MHKIVALSREPIPILPPRVYVDQVRELPISLAGKSWARVNLEHLAHKMDIYQNLAGPITPYFFLSILANFHNAGLLANLKASLYASFLENTFEFFCRKIQLKHGKGPLSKEEEMIRTILNEHGNFWEIPPTETRKVGPYSVLYNPFGALKPGPMQNGEQPVSGQGFKIKPFFNERDFNFRQIDINNIALELIIPMQDRTEMTLSILFSLFPYARGHMLLIPDLEELDHAQFLSYRQITALEVARILYPALQIGWNSWGASATVNQAHFHLTEEVFPVQNFVDTADWPLKTIVFTGSQQERWLGYLNYVNQYVHDDFGFQKNPVFYNILDTKDKTYLFLRKPYNTFMLGKSSATIGWTEAAGRFTVFHEGDLETVTEDQLTRALRNETI